MRLLLVGAFAFPHEQGSQVYFREQALALRDAGAEVHLLTYGSGRTAPNPVADLPQTTLPAWAVPPSRRSGPSLGKPLADLVLATTLRRLVASPDPRASRSGMRGEPAPETATETASKSASRFASSTSLPASRRASEPASSIASSPTATRPFGRFDAILAHHAEAALASLHGLPSARPPVLYCAHTVLEEELPLYFGAGSTGDARPDGPDRSDRPVPRRAIARLGGAIDRWIARRADGWIALTQTSERVIRASSPAPGRRIGPPVADPKPLSDPLDDARRLAELGLSRDGFFLYSGNLDPYQDLPLLEQVARRRAGAAPGGLPLVVATHAVAGDPGPGSAAISRSAHAPSLALARRLEQAGVRVVAIRSVAEARALYAGARATVVPRRSLGGFPIKLVNSLAAGTPIVAYHLDEWGLVDGHEGLIADPVDPVASLSEALARLELDPALAERLGRGARARYGAEHRPALVAAATLELIRTVLERSGR